MAEKPPSPRQPWWHLRKQRNAPPPDPNDPVAQRALLRKAHQKNMRPTWICFGLVLAVVLFETARALYSTIKQQWVEESALHTNKELNNYLEFQYAMFSTFSSRSPSFCYDELVTTKGEHEELGNKERDAITEAIKAYTPSLCIYKKDLYFFEEPTGELASNSLPDLINMVYVCGREFANLLKGVSGDLVKELFTYTQRKIHFIDLAFRLLETPKLTASQWCGVALTDEDVALMHSTSIALDTLGQKIKENESRDTNTLVPVIMMVVLFVILNPIWKRRNVFKRVFHQRFEHLWNNLQKIDQVLQRKLENLVMVLQCVTEQRILGRLKIICGVQSILVSSDAPPGLMQMMRLMELLAHRVLHHANTASLHVRLELQSSAETKEMVNMRLLLDGCLEVYKNDIRSRVQFLYASVGRHGTSNYARGFDLGKGLSCAVMIALACCHSKKLRPVQCQEYVAIKRMQTPLTNAFEHTLRGTGLISILNTERLDAIRALAFFAPVCLLEVSSLKKLECVLATCSYSSTCPTAVLIDKIRVRSALLRIFEFLCVDCEANDLEVKLTGRKSLSKSAPLIENARNELKPFEIQVIIKARLQVPNDQSLEVLLEGGNLRERKCFAYQLVCAKKVAVDLNGGIKVAENPDGTTNFEFNFQAPGRFTANDFHPNFDGLKNGLVFCMNMNQLPSYSQLTSVCELIGIKVQNVASIPELNDQLATSKQIRALALFVYDNTTHLANAIPCSVPSINRIAELVQVVKAKLPKQKEGKDVAIEIERKPPILTAATVDSRAPRSMIVIEEPLTSSDVVSILAVAAGALDSSRRKRGRGGVLQKLSYGRASFWDAAMTTVNKPDNRASVSLAQFFQTRTEYQSFRRILRNLLEQAGTNEVGQGDSGLSSLSSLDSTAGARKHGPVLADTFRDPVAAFVFNRKLPLPEHTRHYTSFVIGCFNEFGFATDLLNLYKEMIWNKNKFELPDEEDMGFQNLVKERLYSAAIAIANECRGFNTQQIAFGVDGAAYSYNIKTLFQMVQAELEKGEKPPEPPEHQTALPNPDEQPDYTWSISAAYDVPACMLWGVARLNSHLALTPLALHPHRLKEYNRSQASVALEFLFSWDYDLTPLTRVKSAKLAAELFHWVARRAEIEVSKETADRFILALQANYLNNSFHSFNHALHVAQIITLICKDYSFQRWFSFSDQFWMVVAGHPGVGNASLIASRNLCAIMFNEKAVLESYHSFLLMELLRKSETDILAEVPMDVQQAARQRIVRAILATDPAFHFQLADELEALKTANPDISGPATLLDEKTKDACLMRAADNAWVLTNFLLHRKWGERMVLELHFQNTLEEALKLPPSEPSVTVSTQVHLGLASDNVFVPFYSILAWFFPGDLDTRVCVMQANSATWERIRQENAATESTQQADELKEMRLTSISASLKAVGEEMAYQSSKVIIDEASNPKFVDCYQYDEAPYRELLEEQQRLLEEQRRKQEELEMQRELAFQAARREEEEKKLKEEEERKAKEEAARKLKEQQEAEQKRKEERRRRRAEMGSDSDSETSSDTSEAEEKRATGTEKPRPSISPLAEGFRSIIEKELTRSRRHSQDSKSQNGGEGIAADGLSPLPSNVIDELEPDIEPEGPLGYEADVQAIAALLAAKRMQAAAEERDDRETPTNSRGAASTPRAAAAAPTQQASKDTTAQQQKQLQKPPTAAGIIAGVTAADKVAPPATEHQTAAPQLPEVKQASPAQPKVLKSPSPPHAEQDVSAPGLLPGEEAHPPALISPAAPLADLQDQTATVPTDDNIIVPFKQEAAALANGAEQEAEEAAPEVAAEAAEEEETMHFDEYGFVYDEHGYAYDAQGVCRGYFGQDGTFYYYDVGLEKTQEEQHEEEATLPNE
ncbi:hypothetical protein Esti_002776 [Eimeria stiedai]